MRQKPSQQFDVCLKRHRTKRFARHDSPHDESAPIRERV
jgi:hypothetical protein